MHELTFRARDRRRWTTPAVLVALLSLFSLVVVGSPAGATGATQGQSDSTAEAPAEGDGDSDDDARNGGSAAEESDNATSGAEKDSDASNRGDQDEGRQDSDQQGEPEDGQKDEAPEEPSEQNEAASEKKDNSGQSDSSDDAREDERSGDAPADGSEGDQDQQPGDAPAEDDTDDSDESDDTGDADSGVAEIDVTYECDQITATSTKDLSNVVLEFTDGVQERFEGLTGLTGTFEGTGDNAGKTIATVWVKSGSYMSGDGPGFGERFDVDESICDVDDGGTDDDQTDGDDQVLDETVTPDDDTQVLDGTVAPDDDHQVFDGIVTPDDGQQVLGVALERDADAGAADAAADVRGEQLPRTGTNPLLPAAFAIALMALGALLLRREQHARVTA